MITCSIDPVGDTDTYRFFGDEIEIFHGHTHSSAAPMARRPVIYPLDGIWKKQ